MKSLFTIFAVTLLFGLFLVFNASAHEAKCECTCSDNTKSTTSYDQEVQYVVIDGMAQESITGVVTAVGENAVNIQNDATGKVHQLWSENGNLVRNLNVGYRVAASINDGNLLNIKVLGLPAQADPLIIKIPPKPINPK